MLQTIKYKWCQIKVPQNDNFRNQSKTFASENFNIWEKVGLYLVSNGSISNCHYISMHHRVPSSFDYMKFMISSTKFWISWLCMFRHFQFSITLLTNHTPLLLILQISPFFLEYSSLSNYFLSSLYIIISHSTFEQDENDNIKHQLVPKYINGS